jgi:spermidine synthase
VPPPSRPPFFAIALLYFVSGALGLVYEVTFSKYLSYVFGATAYASSAVLVAFMGGLAVGAHFAGRAERRIERPLVAYAAAECAIGVFCLAAPWLFGAVTAIYVQLARHVPSLLLVSFARYALASAVVFVPAAGMGVTLPLLSRFASTFDRAAARRGIALLYGMNTAGGALGSLAAAYLVIPALGLSLTLRAGAATSLVIAALAGLAGRELRLRPASPETPSARAPRDLLVLAALSGILVFACEVIFVHLLALVIGTSVYAFGLMLAIVLVCLALGTPLASVLARRDHGRALSMSLALSALALSASLPIWDKLPAIFVKLGPKVTSWPARETVRGLLALAALALPVTSMGTTFPLILRDLAGRESVGADVGRVTAANTVGSIVGSLLAGFAVLPRLGSQRSLFAAACCYAAGALFAARRVARARALAPHAIAAAAVVIGLAVPAWNLFKLTSGAGIYFETQDGAAESFLMVKEDVHGGVTTVTQNGGVRTLWTNGKFQGNDGDEIDPQRGFGHLPSIFAPRFGRALVIGAGTAMTSGVMASYPYERIDLAEISPTIIEAAKTYFGGVNRGVFHDPRLVVLAEDGRNVLFVSQITYDVITIELSGIWFAGAANLYSREFYELAKSRLSEGGILQQWIQFHHTAPREVASILASVRAVFPHVALFVNRHQGHILATANPLVVSRSHLAALEERARAQTTLAEGETLTHFVEGALLGDDALDRFIDDTAVAYGMTREGLVSTDDNLYLEYATPKNNVPTADDVGPTVDRLAKYQPEGLADTYFVP